MDEATNETVNVQFPECPACGARPGQMHDPLCPVGRLMTQQKARDEARRLNLSGEWPHVVAIAGPVPLGAWGGTEEGWTVYLSDYEA